MPRDIKPPAPLHLPKNITRGIIESRHRDVYASLEQRIQEAERVETTLRSLPGQLAHINVEIEDIEATVAEATRQRDWAASFWLGPLKGFYSSLGDLQAAVAKDSWRGEPVRKAEARLSELHAKRADLERKRSAKLRQRDELLPKLPSARERSDVLIRLRSELQRLVDSALAGDDAASQMENPILNALFAKVGACLGEGIPLITLEECVSEMERLAAVPPGA